VEKQAQPSVSSLDVAHPTAAHTTMPPVAA
jgi:hypothetical protein